MGLAERRQVDRVDWFRVLSDLNYAGKPNATVARALGVALATLRGWKGGSEPRYIDGIRLVAMWAETMGRTSGDVPMIDPFSWRA